MESSGAVTIEGENYQVVDECIEEEDTSNSVQHKYVKNVDTEKQSNTSDKNIQQNEDTNERKENIDIKNSVNIDVGENKNTIVKEKSDSYMEKNENTFVEEKNDSYMERNENIIVEEKSDSYMEKNENTIVEEKSDSYMEKNKNTTMEKEECTKIKENENITIRKEEDTNIDTNEDISMEKDEKVPIVDSTNNALSDNLNPNDNDTKDKPNTENKYSQQSNVESIDFTADITLDQLDQQRSITDEDILLHLDEIENIDLDPKDFQIQEENESMEKNTKDRSSHTESKFVKESEEDESINVDKTTSNITSKEIKQELIVEKSERNDWYEKKLIEKETIIKERLSKVARVLGISYPFYEKWLEHEEKINGSPLCKLKPSRRCCLDKPYTNRWKFICNKKGIHESITEVDNPNVSFSKNRKIVWKLEPSGAWGVNINNKSQFPSFVLRAVKIFEDFLQTTEQLLISHNSSDVNFSDDVSIDVVSKKDINNEERQDWLWLVVRCNSMDELMLFATGQNISRSTMDRLKQVYESGPGKDCNVKSLYCKSTNKYDDTTVTDTTFLVGSEALDEIVGGLKVQLAPKTNFWSNTAGAENVATAVIDLLAPTPKTTVLEIGCGIGLIGLMMASKCQQVIGVDSPSEVEEAEMTCELNNIKNASFIMGSPIEVTTKIIAAVKNRKTCAVINANTNVGRAIEVMTALRKIPSLKRIVMITTLTKQSVRAILELARPGDHSHGSPFIPIVACVVDTLPNGPHFEAVILMQRRMINKFNQIWSQKTAGEDIKSSENKIFHEKINQQNANQIGKSKPTELQTKMNFNKFLVKNHMKKSKISIKKAFYIKHAENSFVKNKFNRKRSHSPDKGETPKKLIKKFSKSCVIAWHPDQASKKKKEWDTGNSQLCTNLFYEKKMQERPKEQTDLRERLSHNRLDTDIAQTLKEHQALLEIAKEKLSGPAPTVDMNTAKQLQNMLNIVLEQTNKLQNQLPRSVWDRIASPGNIHSGQRENKQDDPPLKGRYVQEMGSQDILITMSNKRFLDNEEPEPKPMYKKYNNLPPLEPNTIMPVAYGINSREEKSFRVTPERFARSFRVEVNQNRDPRIRRNEMENMKKPISPVRRQTSSPKHRVTPPKRLSPKRPLLSPPRRPCSPPRRHFSPLQRPTSPMYRQRSPIRRQISPLRRPMSPRRMSPLRQASSPRRPSPPRRVEMSMNRPMSPLRHQVSLRQMSPIRSTLSPRRQSSSMKRPISPLRRQIPSPNRMILPNRQDMLLSRRQAMPQERQQTSTMRRMESHKLMFERSTLSRQQSSQKRQMSPSRFTDDWDIPNRRAIEQNILVRPVDQISGEQNIWRSEQTTPASSNNWEQIACNDRRRKSFNQEKWETAKDPMRSDSWNNGGNTWNSKQMYTKPIMKETWSSNSDNKWSPTSMPSSSNDNWNIRGKDSLSACTESWMDNKNQGRWESLNVKDSWKCDKEDLNDLPEDAKDPWGDDGISDLKERWLKFESTGTSNTWVRENEQQRGDSWNSKYNKDNWQNKGLPFVTKSQWQNNDSKNIGESRWLPQSDEKKPTCSGWQNGNSIGSWQFQNSNFQSQRSFPSTQFKSSY